MQVAPHESRRTKGSRCRVLDSYSDMAPPPRKAALLYWFRRTLSAKFDNEKETDVTHTTVPIDQQLTANGLLFHYLD